MSGGHAPARRAVGTEPLAERAPHPTSHLVALATYAIAMACVESALVVYLRALYYPENPLAIFPLVLLSNTHFVFELLRESATLLMIGAVAWLAANDGTRRFAAFLYVFGLWDIFYYAWLKAFIGWPVSPEEWDVLFLIPWPWLGPWLAPVAISLVFVWRSFYAMRIPPREGAVVPEAAKH